MGFESFISSSALIPLFLGSFLFFLPFFFPSGVLGPFEGVRETFALTLSTSKPEDETIFGFLGVTLPSVEDGAFLLSVSVFFS